MQIGGFTAHVPASLPVLRFHKNLLWFLIIFLKLHPMHKWRFETLSTRVQLPLSHWLRWGNSFIAHRHLSDGQRRKRCFHLLRFERNKDSAASLMAVYLPTCHKSLSQRNASAAFKHNYFEHHITSLKTGDVILTEILDYLFV